MPNRRPAAALALAAGLVVIAGGTTGLLLTRHSTPALRPAALGVGAVPAPTGPIVGAFPAPTGPIVAVSQSAASRRASAAPRRTDRARPCRGWPPSEPAHCSSSPAGCDCAVTVS